MTRGESARAAGHTLRMSGTRRAREAWGRALTVLCVVLLCMFGAGSSGPSPATADPRSAPTAPTAPSAPAEPTEPTESPADPAGEPEVRLAVRVTVRGVPGVRGLQRPVFHVKQPGRDRSGRARPYETGPGAPAALLRTVRSVVLRC